MKKELKKKGSSIQGSLSNLAKSSQDGNEPEDFEEAAPTMTLEERKAQSLLAKIENIIPRIYVNCTNNNFKEKWEWPAIDPFTGLYVEQSKKKGKLGGNFSKSMNKRQMSSLLKV